MIVMLSPIASTEDDTPPSVQGDVITFKGQSYDLSSVPVGGEVQYSDPFVGAVKRDSSGELSLTLRYRYNIDTSEPTQSPDIKDYTFTVTSGSTPCPIIRSS